LIFNYFQNSSDTELGGRFMTGAELTRGGDHGSDRAGLDLERRAFLNLLQMTNTQATPREIAWQLVVLARQISGCEAVAIRLKDGPDFPYAASLGFSHRFLDLENNLCAMDEEGHLLRDTRHRPLLACVCGLVLSGRADLSLPCFRDQGGFLTGSTSDLMDPQGQGPDLGDLRGRCHSAGYETVALFPIRRERVTYGLIHCNDTRPHRITPEVAELMETLADTAAHLFQEFMA
jgi:GAF domain-containing protein